MSRYLLPLVCAALALTACERIPGNLDRTKATAVSPAPKVSIEDAVVVAVIDFSFNPYHWDYLAAKMPDNGLPLDQDPATWLPGHPGAAAFKSYQPLTLALDAEDPEATTADLHDADIDAWNTIQYSQGNENGDVHLYWVPGTKIIGHVAFSGAGGPVDTYATTSHGLGTSSVSTGNFHGTCPHCLLVFVHADDAEMADEWVSKQDWIDLQTNSFGGSANSALTCVAPADAACGLVRDLIYAQSDTELQRQTVERGQQIFFSGGNGLLNDFSIPHTNLLSSQKGPDWIVTVGGLTAGDQSSFSGHGRPVDISSLGDGYPSAASDEGIVTAEGSFGGTSNAAPVIAGMYAESLYRIRKQIGSKRVQRGGIIAEGRAGCGVANANCALADGLLTVHELRDALYRSAQYTVAGVAVGSSLIGEYITIPMTENAAELEFLSEGHGSLLGRFAGPENYEAEIARIVGFADGSWFAEQDADQRNWMIADSLCRQGGWGNWDYGYAALGPAPTPDPAWPVRSWMSQACPQSLGAAVQAEKAANAGGSLPLLAAQGASQVD